jgi:hypothetical protein
MANANRENVFLDKQGRRAVVLLDDHYSNGPAPEDLLLRRIVAELQGRDLVVLPRDMFGAVGSLIYEPYSEWRHEVPAPSAWIIDIEIATGRDMGQDICDGVQLARLIRDRDIQRPDQNGRFGAIPIFFLTRFHLPDTVVSEGHPATNAPLAERIEDGVQVAWRFVHKNLPFDAAREAPLVEESLDEAAPANLTLGEAADAVRDAAFGI